MCFKHYWNNNKILFKILILFLGLFTWNNWPDRLKQLTTNLIWIFSFLFLFSLSLACLHVSFKRQIVFTRKKRLELQQKKCRQKKSGEMREKMFRYTSTKKKFPSLWCFSVDLKGDFLFRQNVDQEINVTLLCT
jgi:hypothetical protein